MSNANTFGSPASCAEKNDWSGTETKEASRGFHVQHPLQALVALKLVFETKSVVFVNTLCCVLVSNTPDEIKSSRLTKVEQNSSSLHDTERLRCCIVCVSDRLVN